MSHDSESVRKISKCNVNKAIELLAKSNNRKNRIIEETIEDHKLSLYCNSFSGNRKKKRLPIVGFSKSLVLSEMLSYIARQDWKHALNLFPELLEYSIKAEPALWRYAFIILLHVNDPLYLRQFFEQCVGNRNPHSNSTLLKRILLLPSIEREND